MPFRSEAQRRFMYAKHPEVAKEFEEKTPKGKKLPEHVKGSKSVENNKGTGHKGPKPGHHSPEQQEYGPPSKPMKNEPPMDKAAQIKAATDAIHREHLKRNGCA